VARSAAPPFGVVLDSDAHLELWPQPSRRETGAGKIPLTVKSKTTDIWREFGPRHKSNKGGHNPMHYVQSCGLRSRFVDNDPTGELTVSSAEPADLCRAGEQLVMQALIRRSRSLLNKPEIMAHRKM
jgi:hypothetical protein